MWPMTEGGSADLTDALGNGVGHRIKLVGLLVQQQMVVAKVRRHSLCQLEFMAFM